MTKNTKKNMKKKTRKINKLKNKNIKHTINKSGGKVIAAGGYGCVFKPALLCSNENQRKKNYISKLIKNEDINDEYQEIIKLKPFLKKIPDYNNYFLIDGINICKINKLSDEDLEHFHEKCSGTFTENKHSYQNINQNISDFTSINIPYGGKDMDYYIQQFYYLNNKEYIINKFININNSLILLLNNAIIPFNKLNVYHFDIKSSNILIDDQHNKILSRIIDWGLSEIINKEDLNNLSYNLNRSFQYNLPISVILLNDFFKEIYAHFLNIHGSIKTTDKQIVEVFIIDFINKFNKKYGKGHLITIYEIFLEILDKNNINLKNDSFKKNIKTKFIQNYIVNYIYEILLKYDKDIFEYFRNVFLKNVDVYGLITCYISIYDYVYILNNPQNEPLLNKLRNIFMKYLFTNSCEIIDITSLSNDLTSLNISFENFDLPRNTDISKNIKNSLNLKILY